MPSHGGDMRRVPVVIGVLTALIAGCTGSDNSSVIRSRLQKLAHSADPESFLIIEEKRTQKFVQFGGPELQFDLPRQTLSDAEFEAATRILAAYGIEPVTYMIEDPSTEEKDFAQTTFQKVLDGDVDQAVRLAEAVLFEVYGFDREVELNFIRE
jgi:hypothetical protein